jgi:hypothetical protein
MSQVVLFFDLFDSDLADMAHICAVMRVVARCLLGGSSRGVVGMRCGRVLLVFLGSSGCADRGGVQLLGSCGRLVCFGGRAEVEVVVVLGMASGALGSGELVLVGACRQTMPTVSHLRGPVTLLIMVADVLERVV